MKNIKTALSVILSASVFLFTGCAGNSTGDNNSHRLYVKMDFSAEELKATFVNSVSGETKETVMKKEDDGDGFHQYTCFGDAKKYNKVYFTYGNDKTDEVAFNKLVDGWYISSYGVLPCTEGEEFIRDVELTRLDFKFKDEQKDVFVWTPKDYDPDSEDKYSVIYLLDGDRDLSNEDYEEGTWGVPESVTSAMKQSDFKAIAVGIATRESTRYRELVPDLGDPAQEVADEYDIRYGGDFCDFIVNTVAPTIEEKYNVYTDPAHNSITGSSLGGLESFYIGIEHPEKFGTIGAMSPSFWMYEESTWEKYLKQKDFSKDAPFVYLYAGDDIKDNGIYTKQMNKLLDELDYPEDKKAIDLYEKGDHRSKYWRYIFPEFLEVMHTQKIEAITK
ncbi:MAG: alpha/beta hydrolase [Ruminococcus sp.]|nr:alpha/beta hydrolase [Ruminococcus sp.]